MHLFNSLIQTLHLIITTTLVGLSIANYFYYCFNLTNPKMTLFGKKLSLTTDYLVILPLIFFSFITGTISVHFANLNFSILWVKAAYLLLSLILFLQLFIILLKIFDQFKLWLHINYYLMFICYITIIHDAVLHRTYLL